MNYGLWGKPFAKSWMGKKPFAKLPAGKAVEKAFGKPFVKPFSKFGKW